LRGLIDKSISLEELLKVSHMYEFCYQSFSHNILQIHEFAQNYTKGMTQVPGKEIIVDKKVLLEDTHALDIGKVWGKEWVKEEEFDILVQEFFDNHTLEAFTVSNGSVSSMLTME